MADTDNIIYDVRMAKPMEDRVISLWLIWPFQEDCLHGKDWLRTVSYLFSSYVLFLIIFIFYSWLVATGQLLAHAKLLHYRVIKYHIEHA